MYTMKARIALCFSTVSVMALFGCEADTNAPITLENNISIENSGCCGCDDDDPCDTDEPCSGDDTGGGVDDTGLGGGDTGETMSGTTGVEFEDVDPEG